MSKARPMSSVRRVTGYLLQTGKARMTAKQERRYRQKNNTGRK